MWLFKRFISIQRLLMMSLVIVVIAGCASGPSKRDGFEEPKSLQTMVNFWEHVYARWDIGLVAFHDNRYMDVVYDLAPITQGDRKMWDTISELIKTDLLIIEESMRTGQALTKNQERIKRMLVKAGGQDALFGASERLRGQRGLKSEFRRGLERSEPYIVYFKKVFKAAGLPEEIAYLPHVESSFNKGARSKVGASGMWQFMPSTARSFMPMRANVIDSRFDPRHSAQGAAKLMAYNHNIVPYWPLAITAYNAGVGHSMRASERYGYDIGLVVYNYSEGAFKFASRNFYAEFLAAKKIAQNPEKYFPDFRYKPMPSTLEGMQLVTPMLLRDLAKEVEMPEGILIEMNPSWLRNITTNRTEIPSNYDIWLPKGTMKRLNHHGFYRPSTIQP